MRRASSWLLRRRRRRLVGIECSLEDLPNWFGRGLCSAILAGHGNCMWGLMAEIRAWISFSFFISCSEEAMVLRFVTTSQKIVCKLIHQAWRCFVSCLFFFALSFSIACLLAPLFPFSRFAVSHGITPSLKPSLAS